MHTLTISLDSLEWQHSLKNKFLIVTHVFVNLA